MAARQLSIVVICHEMRREAMRTLRTLGPDYQIGVSADDYQVIAIDNGSRAPLSPDKVRALGSNFEYHYFETDAVSPVEAVNFGASLAQGRLLAVIVDGARMATPGLVINSLRAGMLFDEPLIAALSWHLGPDIQNKSIEAGYDATEEDRLLASINWIKNGYGLFRIATLATSSEPGFLRTFPKECSWICLRRDKFHALGGFDTRFVSPGGGMVNHAFRNRALSLPGVQPVVLLGEGVFHQIHGGVATNIPLAQHPSDMFKEEYRTVMGENYTMTPANSVFFLGAMPDHARQFISV